MNVTKKYYFVYAEFFSLGQQELIAQKSMCIEYISDKDNESEQDIFKSNLEYAEKQYPNSTCLIKSYSKL